MEYALSQRDQRIKKFIGQAMKDVRLQRGFTSDDVCRYAGISASSLSKYERGIQSPKSADLFKFAQAMQCPIAELFPRVGSDY